jgi:hypothetical protein
MSASTDLGEDNDDNDDDDDAEEGDDDDGETSFFPRCWLSIMIGWRWFKYCCRWRMTTILINKVG